jgi:hypothetical protein
LRSLCSRRYFIIDVTATYLFISVPLGSWEWISMLLTAEMFGIIRNVGAYEIMAWVPRKLMGDRRPFPLRDQRVLEELVTIAAVDTVAETMAAISFLLFLIGYVRAKRAQRSAKLEASLLLRQKEASLLLRQKEASLLLRQKEALSERERGARGEPTSAAEAGSLGERERGASARSTKVLGRADPQKSVDAAIRSSKVLGRAEPRLRPN